MIKSCILLLSVCILLVGCKPKAPDSSATNKISNSGKDSLKNITDYDHNYKTIHVIVALCDNKYQGIVPVPAKIGNGQDPNSNLYWGNNYGVRSYFKNSKDWKLISSQKTDKIRLERLVFKHATKNWYLVADAYDGRYIKNSIKEFLYSCSGQLKDTIHINKTEIGINGNSNLVAYVGHDGLMDFHLSESFKNADGKVRDCIVLACDSKVYFGYQLMRAKVNPIVWTAQLMCPEAYTLHDAISAYINNEPSANIRMNAVKAYSKYQKCSEAEAKNILITGW